MRIVGNAAFITGLLALLWAGLACQGDGQVGGLQSEAMEGLPHFDISVPRDLATLGHKTAVDQSTATLVGHRGTLDGDSQDLLVYSNQTYGIEFSVPWRRKLLSDGLEDDPGLYNSLREIDAFSVWKFYTPPVENCFALAVKTSVAKNSCAVRLRL